MLKPVRSWACSWITWLEIQIVHPAKLCQTQPYEKATVPELEVRLTWFGHSTILLETHDTTILFDPVFGTNNLNPLVFGPAPFDYEHTYKLSQLPEIDYVLISHDHYDHLDMTTVNPSQIRSSLFHWVLMNI